MTLPTLAIPGFDNLSHTVYTAASGRQAATDSSAVVLSNEDLAAINAIATALSGTLTVTANVGTGTQPVSGTITANAGTGTFAVSGTFWQATQPVSLTTLPALIAGSAVIGKVGIDQTTPGTTNALSLAYMGSTAVATGNGVVSAGVQRVSIASDNTAFSVNALQSGTWNITNVSGTVSLPTGAATSANQTTLNTNVGSSADAILTAGTAGSLSSYMRTIMEQSLSTGSSTVKFDQTTPGTTNAASISHIGSTAVASGNGVVGAGVLRVAVASDNTPFATKIDQTTDGTTNRVNAVPGSTAYALIPAPSTYRVLSAAATTNGANIKGSAGAVKGIQGYNAKASAVYLKLYNKATAPTVGTDVPVKTIYLPPTAAFAFDFGTGVGFATGIGISLNGAAADNDTTALSSGDILSLNVDYH